MKKLPTIKATGERVKLNHMLILTRSGRDGAVHISSVSNVCKPKNSARIERALVDSNYHIIR